MARKPLTVEDLQIPTKPAKAPARPRGRPIKIDRAGEQVFALTLRVPASLRRSLRQRADDETDRRGEIVSAHDLILAAIEAYLAKR